MSSSEDRIDTAFFPYEPRPQDGMIHTDHLGTPHKMTDANQSIVWSAYYKPFGAATITVSTITNNLRGIGQYLDAETGLLYNYFRDYNPAIGRFPQSDPIGIVPNGPRQGLNHLYAYARNNPIRYYDPKGLDVEDCYRPLNAPILNMLAYHRYLWIDGAGWGLTTADGSSGVTTTSGKLESDNATSGWGVHCVSVPVTDCQKKCLENEISNAISHPPDYNVYSFNCITWVSAVFSRCGISR